MIKRFLLKVASWALTRYRVRICIDSDTFKPDVVISEKDAVTVKHEDEPVKN